MYVCSSSSSSSQRDRLFLHGRRGEGTGSRLLRHRCRLPHEYKETCSLMTPLYDSESANCITVFTGDSSRGALYLEKSTASAGADVSKGGVCVCAYVCISVCVCTVCIYKSVSTCVCVCVDLLVIRYAHSLHSERRL